MPEYRHCHDCNRPLRPVGTRAEDHPGTYANQGRGLCRSDYDRRKKAGTLNELTPNQRTTPPNCRGCDVPLRDRRERAADHPGSREHRSDGYCWRCFNNGTTAVPAEDAQAEAERIAKMRADLTGWVMGWRRRNHKPLNAPIDGMEVAA